MLKQRKMRYDYGNNTKVRKSNEGSFGRQPRRNFMRKFQANPLQHVRKFLFPTILYVSAIGALVVEIILLTRDIVEPTLEDYEVAENVDYGEALTVEDEVRQIFNLIDSIQDGLLTLTEFEAYALFRFRGHTPNSELDEFGIGRPQQNGVENSIIDDNFLNGLDLNGDNVLNDDELTADNVNALFHKAKAVMETFDKDKNQLVTWSEFSVHLKSIQ